MMMITAPSMSAIPTASRSVNASPNSVQLMSTAVIGSSAPRIDAGVDPIRWMAILMKNSEPTVGNSANSDAHAHEVPCNHCSGSPVRSMYAITVSQPNSTTQNVNCSGDSAILN